MVSAGAGAAAVLAVLLLVFEFPGKARAQTEAARPVYDAAYLATRPSVGAPAGVNDFDNTRVGRCRSTPG